MNIKKLNKFEIGELLIPRTIYKLKYEEELKALYAKLYFNNLNYLAITNFFFFSIIISFIIIIFSYETINIIFYNYMASSIFWNYLILSSILFMTNLLIYYILLLFFFFYHKSKFMDAEKEIEKDLPEFLDNLVSNLKGGISLEKALFKSVRKEQIAMLKEVTLINEKIMMGMTVDKTLEEFRLRYHDSAIISRTFFLIQEGLKGGGNLSEPLEKISKNLKTIYLLNDEIKSNAGGFSVVISMISILVGPLLFALAITLLSFIGDLFELLAKGGEESFISVSTIPAEFTNYLIIFSYAMIILITYFSSLITAQLKNEEIYESFKYLPFYIIFAIFIYIQSSALLLSFFKGIF